MLRTRSGWEMGVCAEDVADFEVSADEADAWLKDQLGQVVGKLGAGLRDALLGPEPAVPDTNDTEPGAAAGQVARPTPGLDLLADLTGTQRERLDGDYAAIGRALRGHLGDLAAAALDSVGGDPQRMAAAQERLGHWAQTLSAHGIALPSDAQSPASPPGSGPPEKDARTGAQRAEAPPRETAGEASVEACVEIGGAPTGVPGGIAGGLRALAETFSRRADALAAARQRAVRGSVQETGNEERRDHPREEPTEQPSPAAVSASGAAGDPEGTAAALASLAQGLEGLAAEAAQSLRDRAAQVRTAGVAESGDRADAAEA